MDKIYSNFGPLTTYTDADQAREFLDMFRDIARMKQAQAPAAAPTGSSASAKNPVADQARGWMSSGKTYLISVGGKHYNELDPSEQLKVLNYFIDRLSSTNILSNREDALHWAFRSMPNVFGVNTGSHAVQMGITILREEASRLKASSPSGSIAPSATPPTAPSSPSAPPVKGSEPDQLASATPPAAPGQQPPQDQGKPQPTPPGQPGGSQAPGGGGVDFLSMVGQGLQFILQFLKRFPNTPKVSDQILLEMALATDPKYWFPSGEVAENGFYGPYTAQDGKYWAEVDYDGSTNQFVFSGRYTVIPNDAVQAIQQSVAQGG